MPILPKYCLHKSKKRNMEYARNGMWEEMEDGRKTYEQYLKTGNTETSASVVVVVDIFPEEYSGLMANWLALWPSSREPTGISPTSRGNDNPSPYEESRNRECE
ncbi:hypothetical protein CEXT_618761 [Caerostris extrusa]|uniref:Uncharacterized protein n=1 Tax=Caerostris extrusa TaxID=172846 RepID=A0AAV4X564_CAEEX|nr:hypothetical protein CEXT_618761 [Caerostris extrusa]